jgi:adenylate cyclase
VTYQQIWRRSVANYALGTLVSIVPCFAFYSVAFEYSPEQLRILLRLALPGLAVLLTVDLLVLRAALAPLRAGLATDAGEPAMQRAAERLQSLPLLVLPRIFGVHAVTATLVFNLLILWANRAQGLGIPTSHFPLYWLVNLTVVPVGHCVYEYHATERLVTKPLGELLKKMGGVAEPRKLVRFPLGARIFFFSGLLGLAPVAIGGLIASQRFAASGLELPPSFLYQLGIVGAALALLWVLLLGLVSREIGEQTRAITSALDRIAAGDLAAEAPVRSISEFGRIAASVNEMTAGLRDRQRVRDLFGAYLTRDVADTLLHAERAGATQRREVTVLFLDLRNFTTLSTQLPAETVVEILNAFLTRAVAAIADAGGHVNKFLGDGLLAVFGAPLELPESPDRALAAALDIRLRLAELNSEFAARGWPELRMGAALHFGEAIVGTIGSPEQKLEYTVIGEAVNLASRIEGLNKKFGTEILLTRETAAHLKGNYSLTALGATEVRGIPRPVEVLTLAPPDR